MSLRTYPLTALALTALALPLGCAENYDANAQKQTTMRTQTTPASTSSTSPAASSRSPVEYHSSSNTSRASSHSASPYDKPGFVTEVEDGRLHVMRPGDKWSDKHITLIAAGPEGMTLKALDRDTALAYMASKPGFHVEAEDGRLHVMKPGEKWSDKHITLIGVGPNGQTIKALSKETAHEYLAAKPGFITQVEDGRIHVMKPGDKWSDKHVTLIGAGPANMTVKALSRDTALEYLAARPGFVTEIEDGRIWVLMPGEEKSEKHITAPGRGPMGATIKAVDRSTLNAYFAAQG